MEIIKAKIEDLKPAEYNPRAMTEKEAKGLKESILRFGMVEPIVVNGAESRKNIIIGGHQRFFICKELGWKEIPIVYVNIADIKKEQELNLRLNKNLGHWDYDLLANFDEDLLKDAGFDPIDLDEIFGFQASEEFDVEKELEKILAGNIRRVNDGDLWQLGDHKLLIGDCTKKENWERLLGQEKFDFMFTDPPYKIGYGIGVRKQKTKEGMVIQHTRTYNTIGQTDREGKPIKFGYKQNREYLGTTQSGGVPEFDAWLSIANQFQNPKGANVMIFENWKNIVELWQAIEKYWKVKNLVIWHLSNRCQGFSAKYKLFSKYDIAPLAGEGPMNEDVEEELEDYLQSKGQKLLDAYEIIIYGNKGQSEWGHRKGKWGFVSDHITSPAANASSGGQSIVFGTKPIQILVPYIKVLSPRGGIIMEPFGGSGSTIVASELMKRKCRAIEISPTYGEVIISRFERATNKKAVKL
jgi:DNA modification methylase